MFSENRNLMFTTHSKHVGIFKFSALSEPVKDWIINLQTLYLHQCGQTACVPCNYSRFYTRLYPFLCFAIITQEKMHIIYSYEP